MSDEEKASESIVVGETIDQRGLGPIERRSFDVVADAIVPEVVIEPTHQVNGARRKR